jgi:hypothetical protein
VCLYSDQTTNLIADVNGAFPAGTDYGPLDPARLLDTRSPAAPPSTAPSPAKLAAGGATRSRCRSPDAVASLPTPRRSC